MPVEFVDQMVLLITPMRLKDLKQVLMIAFVAIPVINVMLLAHMMGDLTVVKIVVTKKIIAMKTFTMEI